MKETDKCEEILERLSQIAIEEGLDMKEADTLGYMPSCSRFELADTKIFNIYHDILPRINSGDFHCCSEKCYIVMQLLILDISDCLFFIQAYGSRHISTAPEMSAWVSQTEFFLYTEQFPC